MANIVEYNKGQERYPGKDRKGQMKKRPRTPQGVKMHSGVMPLMGRGMIKKALESNIGKAGTQFIKSVRTVFAKEIKNARKSGII